MGGAQIPTNPRAPLEYATIIYIMMIRRKSAPKIRLQELRRKHTNHPHTQHTTIYIHRRMHDLGRGWGNFFKEDCHTHSVMH